MAPTEGRVAKPERQRDCRRGTPMLYEELLRNMYCSEWQRGGHILGDWL